MAAGKSKHAMGSTQKHDKPPPPSSKSSSKSTLFNRSFSAYFPPRSSAQVQPRPPDVPELLKLVEHLRESESILKTQLLEHKLLRETAAIVPALETDLQTRSQEILCLTHRVDELLAENEKLVHERELIKASFEAELKDKDEKIVHLVAEIEHLRELSSSQRFQGLVEVANKSNLIKNLSSRKSASSTGSSPVVVSCRSIVAANHYTNVVPTSKCCSAEGITVENCSFRSRVPRVPKPPPKRCFSDSSVHTTTLLLLDGQKSSESVLAPEAPPPQVAAVRKAPPAPPPPPPRKGGKVGLMKVKREPEVVEFYHSLMRRDSRRESGAGLAEVTTAASAKDLVGEIENRSAYLLAIKTDVETQGDFIRFLIKEVQTAAFTDIEDVVSFVKWLDDELSYLVDERAVLKHFDWPEQKADAFREAAFEYSDLKKLESEASSFRADACQPCSTTLKKMQTLLEKLEHGVYNLSRLRESATNRYKSFQIPVDWMLDAGFVSQIKLASVKLAMKYMKRVSAELEIVGSGPEEEELVVQGVRFAFRVHQFARGFDVETMTAFEELRDKARSCNVQCQSQQPQLQRLGCRSMPCEKKSLLLQTQLQN